jgi:hypothetical protein
MSESFEETEQKCSYVLCVETYWDICTNASIV